MAVVEYNADGDELEALLSDEGYYGERVDETLTLYRSRADNRIVGFVIPGVRKLVSDVDSR